MRVPGVVESSAARQATRTVVVAIATTAEVLRFFTYDNQMDGTEHSRSSRLPYNSYRTYLCCEAQTAAIHSPLRKCRLDRRVAQTRDRRRLLASSPSLSQAKSQPPCSTFRPRFAAEKVFRPSAEMPSRTQCCCLKRTDFGANHLCCLVRPILVARGCSRIFTYTAVAMSRQTRRLPRCTR